MKVAVISDIHGNLEAFTGVLADADRAGADSMICLGDIIGYGPNPEEVVQLLRSRGIPSVMGNHELALARADFLEWFNDTARESLVLSEGLISAGTRDWLGSLKATMILEDALFVHGCPPDSISGYIFERDDEELGIIFREMETRICFVGHTHSLEAISWSDFTVRHHALKEGIFELESRSKYIISVGSVGQPRDDYNNCAKYALWDTKQRRLEIRFVPYEVSKTAEKIISLGFPPENASRLW